MGMGYVSGPRAATRSGNLMALPCSVMAQLTSARFKGETALNFICRLIATFCGGVVGMTIWYISTGSGQGNPYGLAAVCAVFFPASNVPNIYCRWSLLVVPHSRSSSSALITPGLR